jgi:hypothetical protein
MDTFRRYVILREPLADEKAGAERSRRRRLMESRVRVRPARGVELRTDQSGRCDDRHLPVRFAGAFHADLYVVPERCQKSHQSFHWDIPGAIAEQLRHLQLRDAQDPPGLRLRQPARLDVAVDLQRQSGLEQFLFRMRQAKVGEHIAAALLMGDGRRLSRHVS